MPAEYLACVKSEMKSGKSHATAQKICAISYYKAHKKTPEQAAKEESKKAASAKGMMDMKRNATKPNIRKAVNASSGRAIVESLHSIARDRNNEPPRGGAEGGPGEYGAGEMDNVGERPPAGWETAGPNQLPRGDQHPIPEDHGDVWDTPGDMVGERAGKPARTENDIKNEKGPTLNVEDVAEGSGAERRVSNKHPNDEANEVAWEGHATENYTPGKYGGGKEGELVHREAEGGDEEEGKEEGDADSQREADEVSWSGQSTVNYKVGGKTKPENVESYHDRHEDHPGEQGAEAEAREVSRTGHNTENYKGDKKKAVPRMGEAGAPRDRTATERNAMREVQSYAGVLPTDEGASDNGRSGKSFFKFFTPIAKIDATRHMVFGYATTDTEDSQGEKVDLNASFEAAMEWSEWATIKEMHRPDSAAGVAVEIEKHPGIGLYVGAEIVDPVAWEKCAKGVYKGFSIGGKCLARDPENPARIVKYQLLEISLVDRPANPDSMFVVAKRDISASDEEAAGESMEKQGKPAANPLMAKAAAENNKLREELAASRIVMEKMMAEKTELQGRADELAKRDAMKAEILKMVGEITPELKRIVEKSQEPVKTPAEMEQELVSKMSVGELTGLMLKASHNAPNGQGVFHKGQ